MPSITPRALFDKLNPTCLRALQSAAGLCMSKSNHYVEPEHWLVRLFETPNTDLLALCRQYTLDPNKVKAELAVAIGRFKTGKADTPAMATEMFDLCREGWLFGSLECGAPLVRSAHLIAAGLNDRVLGPRIAAASPELGKLSVEKLYRELRDLLPRVNTDESQHEATAVASQPATVGPDGTPQPAANSKTPALDQFTTDLTANAKSGKIDRILGRDAEIRQVIDILTRRRQNNPILTGEAGVGKTAVVEGLALRIVQGDVPEPLRNVSVRTLDLGLLQAGAGVKGEFENRLKSVIQEVKSSPTPIIVFIDEAHTLIGAGGTAGQGDAANLLKPALARGELRTIAATTFDEYKKHFEGDPALKRRFQEVRVDEPDEHRAIRMLRAVADVMQKHHKVRILDEAVAEAVKLGIRYLPERQLPDKAVSLLDTAAARVKLSQGATPAPLDDVIREIEHLTIEIAALERENAGWGDHSARLKELAERKAVSEAKKAELDERLKRERELVAAIQTQLDTTEKATGADADTGKAEITRLRAELDRLQGDNPLVLPVVDGAAVSQIVGSWTGIPVGKMVRNEIETLLTLKDKLSERVVGQDHALHAIAQRIQTSRAELGDPKRPIGVFLLVGPSGVGKTETAMALADLLYGGDRNMVVINMSEFKEEYKVSQLLGSPRGYEGSGEGGVLTEAVRRRPYSVVLLDEIEKSHPSVQEIFYQVFDKGVLNDSRGIEVNFKNTIILLTSNVGTDTVMKACADADTMPDSNGLAEMIRPDLLKSFKPALLGRMAVVPYFPLSDVVLKKIIEMRLKKVGDQLRLNHKATFEYAPAVVDALAARCKEVESGARNVDHILTMQVLPLIAVDILSRQAEGGGVKGVSLTVGEGGAIRHEIR